MTLKTVASKALLMYNTNTEASYLPSLSSTDALLYKLCDQYQSPKTEREENNECTEQWTNKIKLEFDPNLPDLAVGDTVPDVDKGKTDARSLSRLALCYEKLLALKDIPNEL
ncbi:hypothetical protein M0804_007082 [Polistes exclamans]|nr:hypothetical protein M0804_007082 [Polistes exclamans]